MFCESPNRYKIKQESDELRSYLKKSQDNVNVLLDEKRKLLETIRELRVSFFQNSKLPSNKINKYSIFNFFQQQLVSVDRNNKNDGSR